MDRNGLEYWEQTEVLVGADGFARVYIQRPEGAVAWGEILVPKEQWERVWRSYLRDSG